MINMILHNKTNRRTYTFENNWTGSENRIYDITVYVELSNFRQFTWNSIEMKTIYHFIFQSHFSVSKGIAIISQIIVLLWHPCPIKINQNLSIFSCYQLSAILKERLKSFQHFLWMALITCLISLMCAGWGKNPNESEWKLGRVRIMLQTPLLLVPLENTDNLYW